MTRGRRREHYQWNMDIWGSATNQQGAQAEGELLSAMIQAFEGMGLGAEDVVIKLSSRGILKELLAALNVEDGNFEAVCILVDKLDKMSVAALMPQFKELGLSESTVQSLTETLRSANPLTTISNTLPPNSPAMVELQSLLKTCHSYGIADWIEFDPTTVRGLSYYTGPVFEARSRKHPTLRAIAGGGRYDDLLKTLSGAEGGEGAAPSLGAVGFGFGDAVIMELLHEEGLLPDFKKQGDLDVMVFSIPSSNDGAGEMAIKAATILRRNCGLKVDLQLTQSSPSSDSTVQPKSQKWALKHANRIGANHVLLINGSSEEEGDQFEIKDMLTGSQTKVTLEDLQTWGLKLLTGVEGVV
jgi:histidyl-tRNA synthetase